MKQLREQAGLTIFRLAVESGVSVASISRIERGRDPVRSLIVHRVLNTLSEKLGRKISIDEVEGLKVK